MKEYVSTVSSKGQITIPADVRRKLGVEPSDRIAFVVTEEGSVELRPARYTLDSVLGSLDPLPNESADLDQEIEEAVAAEAERRVQRMKRR